MQLDGCLINFPLVLGRIIIWGDDLLGRESLFLFSNRSSSTVFELSQLAYDLNASYLPNSVLKKFEVQAQILKAFCKEHATDSIDCFEILKIFFFERQKYSLLSCRYKVDRLLIPFALNSHSAPLELLLLLFVSFAEEVKIQLQVLPHGNDWIIKWVHDGHTKLFDFRLHCQTLRTEDLLALINDGVDCSHWMGKSELMNQYLLLLKTQCLRERSFLQLYKIQTYLLRYQPFALNHLLDRARAAYAIGDVVRAAEDLGEYLSFHKDTVINNRWVKLFNKMRKDGFLTK